ncbi:hypothetical protein ABMA32_07550 [Mesorhizobium sp. VNQ89]|uniref:hypothetical protein n=1 Tax=Mesorhizobium quangtriensis TaxID=3157709 RepID=UPI0032B77EAB
MHPPLAEEQWEGMRELRGLFPPVFQRIAKIVGCHVTTIRERASRENWPKLHAPKGSMMCVVTPRQVREEVELRARVDALAATKDSIAKDNATVELAGDVGPGDMAAEILEALQDALAQMRTGHFDKGRIDALLSMVKVAEQIGNLKFVAVQQDQKRSDEELADILALIDRRIVELARDYAERMGARTYHS